MSTQRIEFVDLILFENITPDPDPIRRELNQAHIQDLIESFNILPMGPLDPLVVKPIEHGMYQSISGNHRYMALKAGGWVEAPCNVIEPLKEFSLAVPFVCMIQQPDYYDVELVFASVEGANPGEKLVTLCQFY